MSPKTPLSLGSTQTGPHTVPRLPADHLVSVHPVLGLCAVATILLPAHPSLQSVLIAYGIPAPFISMLFAAPVMYGVLSKRVLSYSNLVIILPFLAYIVWLLIRTIGSPALGQENNVASLRGLLILTPLALLCALVGARSSPYSARMIGIFGFLALIHYCVLYFAGGPLGESSGFRSLSSDSEHENYQATSFYVGLVGVVMASLVVRGKGNSVFYGMGGLLLTLMLMGTIGARSAIVALFVSSIVIVLISGFRRVVRLALIFGPLGVLAIALSFTFGFFNIEIVQNHLTVVDRFTVLAEDGDSSQRLRLFSLALQMWFASLANFLFGGGVGVYPQFIGETEAGWYPHNFILESLAEGGLVAGLLLLWIGIEFVTKLRRLGNRNASFEDVFLGALAVYALVSYQFMGGLQTLWIPTFFVSLFLFSQVRRTK